MAQSMLKVHAGCKMKVSKNLKFLMQDIRFLIRYI